MKPDQNRVIYCPVCNKNKAVIHRMYGVLPCTTCNARRDHENLQNGIYKRYPEFVPESIKKERVENAKSMIQPWREGEPSAEYIEAYPEQAEHMFSYKERLTAKSVWKGDLPSYWRKTR